MSTAVEAQAAVDNQLVFNFIVEAMSTAAAQAAATAPVDKFKMLLQALEAKEDLPRALFFQFVLSGATVEDLGAEEQVYFKHVMANGKGVCSYCRYRHGCLRCDHVKAWRFVVNWELRKRGYRDLVVTLEDGFSPSELSKVFRTKTKISSY